MYLAKSVFAAVMASWFGTLVFLLLRGGVISAVLALGHHHPFKYILESFSFGIVPFLQHLAFMPFIPLACLLLIGLPVQYLMQRRGVTRFVPSVGAAMIGAGLVMIVASIFGNLNPRTLVELILMAFCLAFCVASLAWFIRRPDKDVAAMPIEEAIATWSADASYSESFGDF